MPDRNLRVLLVCLFLGWGRLGLAQPTNLAVLDSLAGLCLQSLPDTLTAVQLTPDPTRAYLHPAIVRHLQARHIRIWPQSPPHPVPRLQYRVEEPAIRYVPLAEHRVRRQILLTLHLQLLHPDGYLLQESRCTRAAEDLVPRNALDRLEDPALPETRGTFPPSLWQKYLRPALWIGATAVTVLLFFTLRSSSRSSE